MDQEVQATEVTTLYRYRSVQSYDINDSRPIHASKSMTLYLDSYPVIKRTPCGVWIDRGYGEKKFVNLGALRKWAHPTKEDAMHSFKKRKHRQVEILQHQLICAEASLFLQEEKAVALRQGMFIFQEDPHEPY